MADLSVSITCPTCAHVSTTTMPDDRCVVFYECPACGTALRPKDGEGGVTALLDELQRE